MASSRSKWRTVAIAAVAVGALAGLFRAAAFAWGVRSGQRYAESVRGERAATRTALEAVRLPAFLGRSSDVPCDLERIVQDAHTPDGDGVRGELHAAPADPIAQETAQAVRAAQPRLDALRTALSCTRIDADAALELRDVSSGSGLRVVAMLLAEGRLRARTPSDGARGRPAAESQLSAFRLGLLRNAQHPLAGAADARLALLALARTVAVRAAGLEPGAIEEVLDAHEPALPSASVAFRLVRGLLGPAAEAVTGADPAPISAPKYDSRSGVQRARLRAGRALLPAAALLAMAIEETDRHYREAERVAAAEDLDACQALDQAAVERIDTTDNSFLYDLMPIPCTHVVREVLGVRAALALARAALRLERARLADGRYPDALPADPRLLDPFARQPLRYTPTDGGRGYRMWSVGSDRKGDSGASIPTGGSPDDVLVTAPADATLF